MPTLKPCKHGSPPCPSCRGRRAKYKGDDIEREAASMFGVTRVGQFGGKTDGGMDYEWVYLQVKGGNGTFPTRIDRWLRDLPAGELRGVVTADAPGPGRKRRWLITFDAREFLDWIEFQGINRATD